MSDAEVHVCDVCDEIFMEEDEFKTHMKEEHPPKKEVNYALLILGSKWTVLK